MYDAPIDPIGDVERAVRAERGEVVRGDRLGLAGALEHEELGEDRDGLEEDRERPEDLGDREAVVEEQREDRARAQEVLDAERVYRRVVCWPKGQDVWDTRYKSMGEKERGVSEMGKGGGELEEAYLYLYFMR